MEMGSLCWKTEDATIDTRQPHMEGRKEEKQIVHPILKTDEALVELKIQKRGCDDYLKKMELKISESKAAALKYSKQKEKSKAIFAMKLKKMYEGTRDKIQGARHLIDQSILNVEQARMDEDVYEALKKGEQVLTEIRSKVSIEAFEEIYDHIQERQEFTQYVADQAGDEAEVQNELDQLEAQLNAIGEPGTDSKVEARFGQDDLRAPSHEIKVEVKVELPANQEEPAKEPLLA